jgi:N-acetylglucosamine malate deacetylase 2
MPRTQNATAGSAPPTPISAFAAPEPPPRSPLPRAAKVLAVIARPGQESADLGALLYAFRRGGASLAVLCVTRGEASPLNSTCERLETRRPWELLVAGAVIGISSFTVADYPDGGLTRSPLAELTELVQREIRWHAPDLLLIADPPAVRPGDAAVASDSPDDEVVARAVRAAARLAGVPAVARTTPGAPGARPVDLGADPATARAVQRSATAAHASQSEALSEVKRGLGRLDGRETLRWLVPAAAS